jgi:hypothetical protein
MSSKLSPIYDLRLICAAAHLHWVSTAAHWGISAFTTASSRTFGNPYCPTGCSTYCAADKPSLLNANRSASECSRRPPEIP